MKTDRLLKIIYICLQRERVTVAELADRLEVSRRTIFRDMETLSAAGIPIVTYAGNGGGVGIMEGFKMDKSLLTDDDFSKLATALNSIQSIDGNRDIELLINKLIPPDKRRADGSDIIIDLSSWFENEEIDDMFADVRGAIAERRCMSIAYSTKGILGERLVEPHKLVFKHQSWYLYAYCRMREGFRMFKLTRIYRYALAEERFVAREMGDMVFRLQGDGYQGLPAGADAPVEIVLEYHVRDKDFLMDKLGVQGFQEDGDKGVVRFSTINLPWIADLIMSLQDKVKVLAPPKLKREIRTRIEKMRSIYEGGSRE